MFRPNLRSNFVKVIEQGAHGRKNFRISPGWAVYRVEHIVNVSLQIFLCRIPSCEENLVEDRNQVWVPSGTSLTHLELSDSSSSKKIRLLCGRHRMLRRTPASTLEESKFDGLNYQCRGFVIWCSQIRSFSAYLLQICCGRFSDSFDATRKKKRY